MFIGITLVSTTTNEKSNIMKTTKPTKIDQSNAVY